MCVERSVKEGMESLGCSAAVIFRPCPPVVGRGGDLPDWALHPSASRSHSGEGRWNSVLVGSDNCVGREICHWPSAQSIVHCLLPSRTERHPSSTPSSSLGSSQFRLSITTTAPRHVRRRIIEGRHATTSQISVPAIITAGRSVRRLQLPRICEAPNEGRLPREQGRAGLAQGPGAGTKGPQGAASDEEANGHQPVLPTGPVSGRGRNLGPGER